ncbi:MAG: hypothetical protein JWM62_1751, partial [Frankiales bacterium]|nr:hypothetical protein [Frankiales bacterium]
MKIRTLVAAACLVGLVGGCSSDPKPAPLPPVPSASPAPSALPLPSEAAAETPQGAAAFARYYMDVITQALSSGDATLLRTLSDADCGGCTNFIGAAEGGEPGGRIEDARLVVEFAEAPPL